ncbi:hypothetical protein MHBO_003895 [Bonamia ostreae]|uniref:Uncharacterized protein n=1 Tax=Bonamia ostreae TaxID=126728 RepID=A0ABV2ASN5_9EUKA
MLLFSDIDDDFVCNCNEGIKTQLLEKKYSLVVENVPHATPDIELSDIDDSIPPVKEYKRNPRPVVEDNYRVDIIGMMALLDAPQYAGEWPQIGQVVSVDTDSVDVHWYRGSKLSSWKPCKKKFKRFKRT